MFIDMLTFLGLDYRTGSLKRLYLVIIDPDWTFW